MYIVIKKNWKSQNLWGQFGYAGEKAHVVGFFLCSGILILTQYSLQKTFIRSVF